MENEVVELTYRDVCGEKKPCGVALIDIVSPRRFQQVSHHWVWLRNKKVSILETLNFIPYLLPCTLSFTITKKYIVISHCNVLCMLSLVYVKSALSISLVIIIVSLWFLFHTFISFRFISITYVCLYTYCEVVF